MRGQFDLSDSTRSLTSQLLFGLLFGNAIALLIVVAFGAGAGPSGIDKQESAVLAVGVLSLLSVALPFLASAMRRDGTPWWIVTIALNVIQLARLVPAIMAIGAWPGGSWTGAIWTLLLLPFFGVLTGLGVALSLRTVHRSRRRRRLARAA